MPYSRGRVAEGRRRHFEGVFHIILVLNSRLGGITMSIDSIPIQGVCLRSLNVS